MTALLVLSLAAPIALAPLVAIRSRARPVLIAVAPWTALPALLAALWGAPFAIELPHLLFGIRLQLDVTGRIFLLLTAPLWLLAGVYAQRYLADDPARGRFFAIYLLSMSGNIGLCFAHDLGSFYLFFALMTFAAYGLIVHNRGEEAFRAGRVYIALAVVGEAMLLTGAVVAASSAASLAVEDVAAGIASSPLRGLAAGLLLAGFAVKAGLVPLHVWLPLAHPVAPTPASAVLSGSMIKAGLLGWLRFLPLGEAALPGWGGAVVLLGLVSAFYGAGVGLTQGDSKTVLAYSSISQMGVMSVGIGVALLHPAVRLPAIAAVLVYVLHHGLLKGALFLGVGVAAARPSSRAVRLGVALGLAFAALSMIGAPLTGGSIAKHHLKEAAHLAPVAWVGWLHVLLPLTAIATALLMARFLWLVLRTLGAEADGDLAPGLWVPWAVLLLAVGVAPWRVPWYGDLPLEPARFPAPHLLWSSAWPVGAAAVLGGGFLLLLRRARMDPARLRIPRGDILRPLEMLAGVAIRSAKAPVVGTPPDPVGWLAANWYDVYARREKWGQLLRQELWLTRWSTAGILFLLTGALLFGLLLVG